MKLATVLLVGSAAAVRVAHQSADHQASLATAKDTDDQKAIIILEAHYGNGDQKLSRAEYRAMIIASLGEEASTEYMNTAMETYDRCTAHHSGAVAKGGLTWDQLKMCIEADKEAGASALAKVLKL